MATISWDGITIRISEYMQVLTLDKGFLRVRIAENLTLELLFGAIGRNYNPQDHNRSICKATGTALADLHCESPPYRPENNYLLYRATRLLILHMRTQKAVLAAFFSAAPGEEFIREFLTNLRWADAKEWRSWNVLGITFETPPKFVLQSADFKAGKYRIVFRHARQQLVFERLAPADVILNHSTLPTWSAQYLRQNHGKEYNCIAQGDETIEAQPQPSLRDKLFFLKNGRHHKTLLRHDVVENTIFICMLTAPTENIISRLVSAFRHAAAE